MTAPRVMFVRPGPIGNALAVVPALRALKRAWPEAFVTLLMEKGGAEALAGCPYADEILIYDKRGADAGLGGWLRTVFELRKRKFTHAILSKRFFRASLLAYASGAKTRVGFEGYGFGINKPAQWDPNEHVVKTNLALMAALGINPSGYELEIWPSDQDKRSAEKYLAEKSMENYPFPIAIHAGGVTQREYLWPAKNYAALAVELEKKYFATPIFVGGAPDKDALDLIRNINGDNCRIASGLNIRAVAHLISKCRVFVGSDSAPSHLALAVKTPSLIYYGAKPGFEENSARWKPLTGTVVAATPAKDGSHPSVERMMEYVAELLEKANDDKKIQR